MRLTPGTPHPEKGVYYTQEQLAKLDTIKDDRFTLGIAKAQYANHVLDPDGTLHSGINKVRQACAEALKEFDARIADARKRADKSAVAVMRATKGTRSAARREHSEALSELGQAQNAQLAAAALANEIEDHLDEERFLIVVNETGVPQVYFQCAVAGNPDMPPLKKAKGGRKSAKRGK